MSAPSLSSPLQHECDIGPYHWPPAPNEGRVVVKVRTSIEVDTPKPNGKDPVKANVKGKKTASLTLEFTWTRRAGDKGNEIRLALDPHGPNSGKAWDIRNPEPNTRGIDHIMITDASELTINGDMYSFSLTAQGWKEPQKAAVGGTKTPTKAVPASAQMTPGVDFPTVPLGEIQPTGLDGPNAPNAEP